MTPQERELLTTFLEQLAQTKADPKDPEAETLIRDAISRQGDANYLLVQRAVGLDLALRAMQAQAAKLQAELDLARKADGAGFLGNASSWGRAAPAATAAHGPSVSSPQSYGKGPTRAGTNAAPASPWGSGMLANLATTAAGVVAGSFLYQGIQQLMGQQNAGSGLGGNSGTNSPAEAARETNDTLAGEEVSDTVDDSNDSLALDDGEFDSSDLG